MVIGAGVAGATCAARLASAGLTVTVLDKGRGPGGRCSTRRIDERRFDHGAQFFTAKDEAFATEVAGWVEAGAAAEWEAPLVRIGADATEPAHAATRYVGAPTMSALLRHLQRDLQVQFSARVVGLTRFSDGWRTELEDGSERGAFDAVLVAIPAPQAAPLLKPSPDLHTAASAATMAPCFALMAELTAPWSPGWGGAFVDDGGPLAWIAHEGSKPGRAAGARWVAHASAAWTREHHDDPPEQVQAALLAALAERGAPTEGATAQVHRWGYARAEAPAGEPALFDTARYLGACGDWCLGERIEDAFRSGAALADAVLAQRK